MSDAKRRRAAALAAIRPVGVSDSALSQMISNLKDKPELLAAARGSSQTRLDLIEHASQLIRGLTHTVQVPLQTGGHLQLELLSPVKLPRLFLKDCLAFRNMFMDTTACTIASHEPLSIILYHDEFTPAKS